MTDPRLTPDAQVESLRNRRVVQGGIWAPGVLGRAALCSMFETEHRHVSGAHGSGGGGARVSGGGVYASAHHGKDGKTPGHFLTVRARGPTTRRSTCSRHACLYYV
jgi:hypothetical protein